MTTQAVSPRNMTLPLEATLGKRRSISWWGMVLLIINEAVIFASLLAAYFYLRFNSPLWPPQGIKLPELTFSGINTAILIISSFFMQWSVMSIKKGRSGTMRMALLIGLILGAIFLAIQVYEYTQLEFKPMDNAYGSLFWGITGVHFTHVLVGLLMNIYIQIRAGAGHFKMDRYQAVENVVLYWHFVDVVWIFIFLSLFISPYW
jgi:heme/copper-type cytochrome/quinol oxidase subunit 3